MKKLIADESGDQLKQAIESADFAQALRLVEEYAGAIRRQANAAATSQERRAIYDEGRSFLQDRLALAPVMRAHIASQLHSAIGLSSYLGEPVQERKLFAVKG